MSAMFVGACPEVRIVSSAQWHDTLSWPRSTFALHQYPALEALGPFAFNQGDARSKAYFLPQIVLILTLS